MLEALHIYHSFYVRMDRYPVGSQALDTVDGLKRIGFGSKKHCQLPLATVELADLTHRIKSSEKAIPFEITRVSCSCLQKADSLRNGLATLATKDWVQLVASALQWLQRRSYRISLIWLQHSWKQVMKDMKTSASFDPCKVLPGSQFNIDCNASVLWNLAQRKWRILQIYIRYTNWEQAMSER